MDNMAKTNKENINQIAGKLEKDQRLALLALASKQDDTDIMSKTDCPTSEEFALLIESQTCETFNRNDLLQHISHCTRCYEEWLVLSTELLKTPKKKNRLAKIRYIFSNTRNLTAAGSALAIAASITIFLAIPPEDIKDAEIYNTPIQQSESVQAQDTILLKDAALPIAPIKSKRLSSSAPKPSVALSSEKGKENEIQELGTPASEPIQSATQKYTEVPPPDFAKKEVKKKGGNMAFSKKPLTETPLSQFATQIQDFCDNANTEMDHAILLYDKGQELLANKGAFNPEEMKIVEYLIEQLGRFKGKAELCQELQRTLSSTP